MKHVNILLLTSETTDDLASKLHDVLNSAPCSHLNLQYEVVNHCYADPGGDGDLHAIVEILKPELCFIGLSPRVLGRVVGVLQYLRAGSSGARVVMIMDDGEPGLMVELLRHGAIGFVSRRLRHIDIIPHLWRLAETAPEREPPTLNPQSASGLKKLIGKSPTFLAEINKIPSIAKWDASVLVSGETGTGKELCARAIHYLSPRAQKPFVPINCGAIPTDLIENELFGHERGAFTGAATSEAGLIHEAEGGTLFMDEIDCLPLLAQVKVLRFLQEKEYRALGSTKTSRVSVRVIAATNVDMQEAVRAGKLRRDLYFRLNVMSLSLPPLRARRDDIPLLARNFMSKYAAEFGNRIRDISDEAQEMLMRYDWPGNIRELENVIERAVLLSEQPSIRAADIDLPCEALAAEDVFQEQRTRLISVFEKNYIQNLLIANQGNVSKAARVARRSRRTFWRLISKYQIDVQSYRAAAK
jgi:DNA-binding NtrC family response regulator